VNLITIACKPATSFHIPSKIALDISADLCHHARVKNKSSKCCLRGNKQMAKKSESNKNSLSVKMAENCKLNYTIAEELGWTEIELFFCPSFDPSNSLFLRGCTKENGPWKQIPDYCSDLNALQQAVSYMIEKHGTVWVVDYDNSIYSVIGHHDHSEHDAINAPALQRAKAFVKTMELYKEKKNE